MSRYDRYRYMTPEGMVNALDRFEDKIDILNPVVNAAVEWYNNRCDKELKKSVEIKLAKTVEEYIRRNKQCNQK